MVLMNSSNNVFVIRIAKNMIRCSFMFSETASFFSDYLTDDTMKCGEIVTIDDYDIKMWLDRGNELNAYGEYSLLCGGISDYLLRHNSCLIHAVAFKYKDRAYLITGSSGIGKSTQIKYLLDLFPGEFSVICGDRPCLKFSDNGSIFVYPTPWNGKENWSGAGPCELAGVFSLTRGDETDIALMTNYQAIFPVFTSIISRREENEDLNYIGLYTEKIIEKYPVYRYVNGGVPFSTKMFYATINKEAM